MSKEAKALNTLNIAVLFVGGLAEFLLGMHIMATGLQKYAGSKMKTLLGILTKNKITSIAAGALVTAIIQSSSATTVMIIGFVNAGIMNLTQACGVIMGANIGTTVTSWIVSSSEWASFLEPTKMAPVILGIGVVMLLFAKSERKKKIGEIIAGFGLLFLGIAAMSSSVAPLRELPAFGEMFIRFGSNPFLGIAVGALVTAIIQSSSASVGILQSLAAVGLVPINAAVYIIMGQNIGTCITALFSSIGASKSAKCAAYIHLLFNVIGTVVFSFLAIIFFHFISPQSGTGLISLTGISTVHIAFNIASTLLLFPFPHLLIWGAKKIAGLKEEELVSEAEIHLDDRMLETPAFAIEHAKKEAVRMGNMVLDSFDAAWSGFIKRNKSKAASVFESEHTVDHMDSVLTGYLVKVSKKEISTSENDIITWLLQSISDFERIGDHSENIAEIAQNAIDNDCEMSKSAVKELKEMYEHTRRAFEMALKVFETDDKELALEVVKEEEIVDELEIKLRASHIKRLTKAKCTPQAGVMFLDAIINLERISDHSRNIAESILESGDGKSEKIHKAEPVL